ncbi:hemolysin family protein [Halodesulfovibrio marinisediminis]|uniref:Magnesium and cobalt transporter n=1 Tax=Halodesulfovibrio marinisediminis DSM 17456 TaxID=1121457 RepID=A0A1N6I621_9BACT|nr:hemolysin family protein [Halodesulfovibrio marinisediminis]SIO27375.1 magnesium and cobalt transporter [Halodesulfovibrio marinisediminis DSM 17456]
MDGGSESRLWNVLGNFFSKTTEEDVEKAIIDAREEGELEAEEGSMLLNVLSLDETQVHEIMVPRTDIICAETTTSIGDLVELIVESGHSRIPLYEDNRDNIVGIIYAKDLLIHLHDPALRDSPLISFMRKPFFVPETKIVTDLLQEFRTRKQHIAIAVDEYGGTSGLITIEDILEEIVGEIEDEYDTPKLEDIRATEDGNYIITGRASLDDVSEELSITLESEQVETLGGFLSELAGHVPQSGETFQLSGYNFTIEDADAKQIRLIRTSKADEAAETQ